MCIHSGFMREKGRFFLCWFEALEANGQNGGELGESEKKRRRGKGGEEKDEEEEEKQQKKRKINQLASFGLYC